MVRTALVTGGTRGIGAAISIALRESDYGVAANYGSNDDAAQAFARAHGIQVYKFDVGDFDSCRAGIEQIEKDIGVIDILVNNAGITRDGFLAKMSVENWQSVIDVNLGSCFNTSHAIFSGMRKRGFGRIINISSINGEAGQLGQSNYSAAKAGMLGFTKALAQEGAGSGITVNAIAPGYINTEMVQAVPEKVLEGIISRIPVKRLGEPDEIARAVLFLAAEEAGYITGATIDINGGQYMR